MSGVPSPERAHLVDDALDDAARSAVLAALRSQSAVAEASPTNGRQGGAAQSSSGCGEWSVAVAARDRRAYSDSIILDVTRAGKNRRLFAKVVHDHADDQELRMFGEGARREQAGLLAAAIVAGPADPVRTPRLLGWDVEAGVVLMDFEEGRTLDRNLAAARWWGTVRHRMDTCGLLMRLGRWLSRFQQAVVDPRDGVDRVNWWMNRCERILGRVGSKAGELRPRVGKDWSRRVLERLDYLGWQLPPSPPLVACHGDLGPWNVLVSDRRLAVIDFAAFHVDLPTMDVANLVTYLEYLEASISYRRDWLTRYRQAFLRGYAGERRNDNEAPQCGSRSDEVDVDFTASALASDMGRFSLQCQRISRLHDAVFRVSRRPCAAWRRRAHVERQIRLLLDGNG